MNQYIVGVAPRQSGKTTALINLTLSFIENGMDVGVHVPSEDRVKPLAELFSHQMPGRLNGMTFMAAHPSCGDIHFVTPAFVDRMRGRQLHAVLYDDAHLLLANSPSVQALTPSTAALDGRQFFFIDGAWLPIDVSGSVYDGTPEG